MCRSRLLLSRRLSHMFPNRIWSSWPAIAQLITYCAQESYRTYGHISSQTIFVFGQLTFNPTAGVSYKAVKRNLRSDGEWRVFLIASEGTRRQADTWDVWGHISCERPYLWLLFDPKHSLALLVPAMGRSPSQGGQAWRAGVSWAVTTVIICPESPCAHP
jgi:hypothetical protein